MQFSETANNESYISLLLFTIATNSMKIRGFVFIIEVNLTNQSYMDFMNTDQKSSQHKFTVLFNLSSGSQL